jgi:Family of unknown function (DUF6328)
MMAEDRKERVDRELLELLNELRIVLPGAQVLFAFLLTLPFTFRFEQLTRTHRGAYFAAFLCTAVGTVLLMAPSANHRLRFREHDKERMLFWFNRLALAGSAFLAAAITLVVFVVSAVLFDETWAAVVAGLMTCWIVVVWYVVPLWQRVRGPEE